MLKEGIYEDQTNRDVILALARFRTSAGDKPASLDDYVGRMKEGQDAIFYITGEDAEALARSPQVEGFRARGVEVLLMADPIDDFWIQAVGAFEKQEWAGGLVAGGFAPGRFVAGFPASGPNAFGVPARVCR